MSILRMQVNKKFTILTNIPKVFTGLDDFKKGVEDSNVIYRIIKLFNKSKIQHFHYAVI